MNNPLHRPKWHKHEAHQRSKWHKHEKVTEKPEHEKKESEN